MSERERLGWRGDRRRLVRALVTGGLLLPAIAPLPAVLGRQPATPVALPSPNPPLELVADAGAINDGPPREGGRLRLVRPRWPVADFNPAAFTQDFQVTASYLDPLLRPDALTLAPTPWLAESWQWSRNGRTLTYSLRPDVRWHDGSPFTAADARFSFTVYRDALDSAVRNFFSAMVEIEAPDDRTLVVTLSEPDSGWLFNASSQPIFQRAQYLESWTARPIGERTLAGSEWEEILPLGTGPWRITDWNRTGVTLARNESYWAGAAHAADLGIEWRETAGDRLAAWEANETDVVWPVRSAEVTGLTELTGRQGRLYLAEPPSVMFAAFNFVNPTRAVPGLFDDVAVRRALSLAVDRADYAADVFGGFVDETAAGTVAQEWARDRSLRTPERDLSMARRLLSAAGWEDRDGDDVRENPDGLPFAITVIFQADGRPELGRVLASVSGDLAEIGVALTVEPLPHAEFRERWLTSRVYDLIAYNYDLYPGFTDFDLYGSAWDIRTNPQGWNPGGYANTRADGAIAAALVAIDLEDQRAALARLQRAVDDDLFALWLGFPQDLVLVGEEIGGFRPNALWPTADTREWWRR